MALNYKEYLRERNKSDLKIAKVVYDSPQNLTTTTVYEKKRILITLYFLFIFPGIIYNIFVYRKLDELLIDKYNKVISLLWTRASYIEKIVGIPNLVLSTNHLTLPNDQYSSQSLELIMKSIFSNRHIQKNSLKPYMNVDNSLRKAIREYGLKPLFFDMSENKLTKKQFQDMDKVVHSERHISSTAKILFTYGDSMFNVTNYISSTRIILKEKNIADEVVYRYDQIENSAGIGISTTKSNTSGLEFIINSKAWSSNAIPEDQVNISEYFPRKFSKEYNVWTPGKGHVDVALAFLSEDFQKKLLMIGKKSTPFIIKVKSNSEVSIFWEELDKTVRPLSDPNLIRFSIDYKYGIKSLTKEVFYIKQMYAMIDLLQEEGVF